MGALLAFAPFVVFALIERSMGPVPGLAAGAVASFALLLRDRMRGEREPNILEAGSAVMFSGLTALALIGDATAWSLWRVRLWVDLGLLLIVLFSIAIRRPFTLHHARRRVSPEVARSAAFLRVNDLLSGAWGAAFAVLAAADALMVLRPLPTRRAPRGFAPRGQRARLQTPLGNQGPAQAELEALPGARLRLNVEDESATGVAGASGQAGEQAGDHRQRDTAHGHAP